MPYETIIDVELVSKARYEKQFSRPWEDRDAALHRTWNIHTVAMDGFTSSPVVIEAAWMQRTGFEKALADAKKGWLDTAEGIVDRLERERIRDMVTFMNPREIGVAIKSSAQAGDKAQTLMLVDSLIDKMGWDRAAVTETMHS